MFLGAPPVQKFFESQRLRISYWDWGNEDKPTFVFVHGGYDHARSWDRIIEAFRDDYNYHRPYSSLGGLTPTEFAAQIARAAMGARAGLIRSTLSPDFANRKPNPT